MLACFGSLASAERYLTVEEALRRAFPEAEVFETKVWVPDAEILGTLEKSLKRQIPEREFVFHVARQKGNRIGDAIVLNEIGKHQPITFLFAITDGRIKEIFVLEFRESRGSEVRRKSFLKQYIGKKNQDGFRIGKEIDGITGATLSGLATSIAAKKALLLWEMVYQKKEKP